MSAFVWNSRKGVSCKSEWTPEQGKDQPWKNRAKSQQSRNPVEAEVRVGDSQEGIRSRKFIGIYGRTLDVALAGNRDRRTS